jgi:nitrogen fixation protein FixH
MSTSIVQKGTFWALVPVVLLGGLVVTMLGFVHLALSDPGFAVRDRYYSKALSWDEQIAGDRRSAELGWRAELETVRVADGATELALAIRDREGKPVRGARIDVNAFSVARSRRIVRSTFTERTDGGYGARLAMDRGGRWEFAIDATQGPNRFSIVIRRDMAEPGVP